MIFCKPSAPANTVKPGLLTTGKLQSISIWFHLCDRSFNSLVTSVSRDLHGQNNERNKYWISFWGRGSITSHAGQSKLCVWPPPRSQQDCLVVFDPHQGHSKTALSFKSNLQFSLADWLYTWNNTTSDLNCFVTQHPMQRTLYSS